MNQAVEPPLHQIRGDFDQETMVVYQAFSDEIAERALSAGTFVAPFRTTRMTWIKPSFCWTIYRSGWATKPSQNRVLAIGLTRSGFEWALEHSCLSQFDSATHDDRASWGRQLNTSPVRIQWDPERSLTMQALPYRTIQIGLSGASVTKYLNEWITSISDVTPTVRKIAALVELGSQSEAERLLPNEQPYPLSNNLRRVIAADLD